MSKPTYFFRIGYFVLLGIGFIPAGVLFLLKTSVVQEHMRKKVEQALTVQFKTKVNIDFIFISLPSELIIENVRIYDHHQQPFITAKTIMLSLENFSLNFSSFCFKNLFLDKPVFRIITYSGEDKSNVDLWLSHLTSQDTSSTTTASYFVKLHGLIIQHGQLVLHNQNKKNTPLPNQVNFHHVDFDNITLNLKHLVIDKNSYSGDISQLTFVEKNSGFTLNNLACSFSISDSVINLPLLFLHVNQSWLLSSVKLTGKDLLNFSRLEKNVLMDFRFWDNAIFVRDVSMLFPEVKSWATTLRFKGRVMGSLQELALSSFAVNVDEDNKLFVEGKLYNLLQPKEFHVQDLKLYASLSKNLLLHLPIEPYQRSFLESLEGRKLFIDVMGSGGLEHFDGKVNLTGLLGDVSLDVESWMEHKKLYGKALLLMHRFFPGFISSELPLQSITGKVNVFFQDVFNNYRFDVHGEIDNMVVNGRTFDNIALETKLTTDEVAGNVRIDDQACSLNMEATVNLRSEKANFSAYLNHLNLNAYGFQRIDTLASHVRGYVEASVQGFDLEKIGGWLHMRDVGYQEGDRSFKLNWLNAELQRKNESQWSVTLSSDIANANIEGKGKLSSIVTAFQNVLAEHFPTIFYQRNLNDTLFHQIRFHGSFTRLDTLLGFFVQDMHFSDMHFTGYFDEREKKFRFDLNGLEADMHGVHVENPRLTLESMDKKIFLTFQTTSVENKDLLFQQLQFSYVHNSNAGDFSLDWNNTTNIFGGSLHGNIFFNPSQYILVFSPSSINWGDSVYTINGGSMIVYDTTGWYVKKFNISTLTQSIEIDGIISESVYEPLQITCNHVLLHQISTFFPSMSLPLNGVANGYVLLFGLLGKQPSYQANLVIQNLHFDRYYLGDLRTESFYDPDKHAIAVKVDLAYTGNVGTIHPLILDGYYFLGNNQGNIEANVKISRLNIAFVEPFLEGVMSQISGYADGNLRIGGTFEKPTVTGDVTLRRTMLRIDYLNTFYSFSHTFHINDTIIEGRDVLLYDAKGNVAKSDLILRHHHFSDFTLDLTMRPEKFEVLNTTVKDNELFYGKGYFTGVVKITGPFSKISIDVVGNTEKGTQLNLPLYTPSSVYQNNFIIFRQIQQESTYETVNLGGVDVNLDITVTPDAEAQIIFDPKVGDIIRGSVEGRLRIATNDKGDLAMFGNVTVVKGDYLFTLQNVINKKFYIEPGGTISWSGDPYAGQLDVTARYEVKTSLFPIMYVVDESDVYKKKVPVYCMMHLTGNLLNPSIKLDIALPEADETTRNLFRTIVNSDEELNKQVFALLMFNTFLPKVGGLSSGVIPSGASASSFEMLSSQFSHLLSQWSKDFDIDVRYRQGDQLTQSQLEVGLGTKLFNERLSIETNLMYGGNSPTLTASNAKPLTGDLVLEYKVSKDGNFRIKAFNQANTFDVAANSIYTQGVAVFYRKEFEHFRDIWRKKKKTNRKNK